MSEFAAVLLCVSVLLLNIVNFIQWKINKNLMNSIETLRIEIENLAKEII